MLRDPLDDHSTLSSEKVDKKPVPQQLRRKIKRRSFKRRWNRYKHGSKRYAARRNKEAKNVSEELNTEESQLNTSEIPSEGNSLTSIKTEKSPEKSEPPLQVLRVRSLTELGDPSISQRLNLVPNPHVQRHLVRLVKSKLSDNIGKRFILNTSPTGVKYLTPVNPGLQDQGEKKRIIVRQLPIAKPPILITQPTKASIPANQLLKMQQQSTQILITQPKKESVPANQLLKMQQESTQLLKMQPTSTQLLKFQEMSTQQKVSKEPTIPAKLQVLKMQSTVKELLSEESPPINFSEASSSSEIESHKCAHCKIEFPTQSALIEHLKMIKFQCHACQMICISIRELKMHLKSVHKIKGYKCTNCSFFGTSMWDLKLHQSRDHCQEYMNPCDDCDKVFKTSAGLEEHIKLVHESSCTQNLLCDMCGKAFKNYYTLMRHCESIHQNLKYPCKQCGKISYSRNALARHRRWHYNKEKIVCDQCGKAFSIKSDLVVHMRQHTGEKPYQCSICSKAFAKRTTLRQHLLTHTGKRPYVCDICGRSFTQKPGLSGHRKSHPGVLPPMPSLFIDGILKDLPEDAFQNLGRKANVNTETTETTANTEGNENAEGNENEDASKEKETEEEKEKNDEKTGSKRKVKSKNEKEKKEKKNDSDEWTLDTELP